MRIMAPTAAIIAAMLLTGAATEASAQSSIIVSGQPLPPTLAAWSARVFREIDRRLRIPEAIVARRSPHGIATVKFNCGETGAPADVALYKSSGFHELDRATISAVRRVVSLHPLPAGLRHDQVYIVKVLFANTDEDARRQTASLRRDADKNNAWYNPQAMHTAGIELAPFAG